MLRMVIVVLAVAAGACASTGATPRPFPVPGGPAIPDPGSRTPDPGLRTPDPGPRIPDPGPRTAFPLDAYALTGTALSLRGTPYRNGGYDPSGFDCSGFVYYVFAQHGIVVPRKVTDQYRAGRDAGGGLVPGDLVFFSTVAPGASHVGISIGGDEFVHAPSSSGEVRVERLGSAYWSSRYVGARRISR